MRVKTNKTTYVRVCTSHRPQCEDWHKARAGTWQNVGDEWPDIAFYLEFTKNVKGRVAY